MPFLKKKYTTEAILIKKKVFDFSNWIKIKTEKVNEQNNKKVWKIIVKCKNIIWNSK